MLKQSLEGEIKGMKEELGESTQFKASPAEKLAQAQEDLAVTTKAFEEDTAYLKDLKRDCQTRAREFELTVKDNNAELTALGHVNAILLNTFSLTNAILLSSSPRILLYSYTYYYNLILVYSNTLILAYS